MPIPDQRLTGYVGSATGALSYQEQHQRQRLRLEPGSPIHYVDAAGSHVTKSIQRVLTPDGVISITFDDGAGHQTEVTGIAYDDTTFSPHSWHFPE